MKFLLDTMVISEGGKAKGAPAVQTWLARQSQANLFLSAATIGEIQRGIHKLELRDSRPASRHREWLDETLLSFEGRVLSFTLSTALIWGPLTHKLRRVDIDLLIAATALEHDLTLVTRNVRHFEPTGVRLFNPYS